MVLNAPLTPNGIEQAKKAGKKLNDYLKYNNSNVDTKTYITNTYNISLTNLSNNLFYDILEIDIDKKFIVNQEDLIKNGQFLFDTKIKLNVETQLNKEETQLNKEETKFLDLDLDLLFWTESVSILFLSPQHEAKE